MKVDEVRIFMLVVVVMLGIITGCSLYKIK